MLEGCIKTIFQHPPQCKGLKSRQAHAFLNHYTSRKNYQGSHRDPPRIPEVKS